ncbi:hypothetical protein CCP4SC76_240007 [Gammaproteobacteria bacterium]
MESLHNSIFRAFNRHDDHLYSFYFSSNPSSTSYGSSYLEEDGIADITRIDSLPLKIKDKFEYLFDFDSDSEFWHEVTLEEIQPLQNEVQYPTVIKSQGDLPEQYPDFDDDIVAGR